MQLTFKARLSLWHMVVVAAILALTAASAGWAFSRVVRNQLDAALVDLAETEAALVRADGGPVRVHDVPPGTAKTSFVRLDKFVQIVALDGGVVARSATLGRARLPAPLPVLDKARARETVFETLENFGEEPLRVVTRPADIRGVRYAIQVAASLDDAYAVLRAARLLFLGMAVIILAAVGLTGGLLARRALRPIDQIVKRARQIGETHLAERLPPPGTRDEIGRLVDTLNEMLARIERSVEGQRRFTSDASHELRSPLSRLRAELEVTLRRPRDAAEYEESLRSCLDEVVRLSRLTEQLLVLARLDAGEGREVVDGPVDLTPILEESMRRLLPDTRQRRLEVVLKSSPDLSVRIAPGAAGLVVSNLLDNAVKFSPPGGRVIVEVRADGGEAVVAVSDTGPGIAADEMPQLFERFYRGAAARASEAPGVGLGLAISRAIVEKYGGRITVDTRPEGGATFSVRLPLAS
jgi:two-component system OmpR family sensor kinase